MNKECFEWWDISFFKVVNKYRYKFDWFVVVSGDGVCRFGGGVNFFMR